ncbi:MAG: ABC transporter permease [Alphaproteobacteria bacterium]|nr:ABC transporter permease [Alphaproteobacteria bacterium]
MARYLIGRIAGIVAVLAVMSFVIYGLIGLMPGDPIDLMIQANPQLTPADGERLKELYGLNVPIWERYLNWLGDVARGDFGYSRTYNRPVLEILGPRLGNTLILLGIATVLAICLSIPLGVFAATRPRSRRDHGINLFCFAGISIPPFWFAILLILGFAVGLDLFPASGVTSIGGGGIADRALHLVLPVTALTMASLAGHTRYMRAAMIETLRADFIRTAQAKGLSTRRVVWGHGLRNALLPLVTVIALDFGTLFSGALITETVFGYLGMGKTIYDAILSNDFNLAMIAMMMATVVVLVGNFLADIGYAALDPRISYRSAEALA